MFFSSLPERERFRLQGLESQIPVQFRVLLP